MLESLKALGRSLLAIGQTRLEIISGEIEEQRALFLREALLTVVAAFCLGTGIFFSALFVLLIAPAEFRAHVAALFAVFFFVACGVVFAVLRTAREDRPKAFAATLQEFGKDRDSLR